MAFVAATLWSPGWLPSSTHDEEAKRKANQPLFEPRKGLLCLTQYISVKLLYSDMSALTDSTGCLAEAITTVKQVWGMQL